MLIAWSPMTGLSCLHTNTDIRHGRSVSYHNLRLESQVTQGIPYASRKGSLQYRPPGQEEAAPVWRTLELHTRLELLYSDKSKYIFERDT